MARKKSKLDKATDIVAKIIRDQLDTLPRATAEAKRKKLHDVAIERILDLRKGNKLAGLRMKDLIHEGHKY
jgi:hypothetical protein